MLMIIPDSLYGRVGAVLSALIVIACFVGLTLHPEVFSGVPRKDFFWYYTNLSNLLVALYFSTISPFFYAKSRLYPLIPFAEFSVTMSIMLTHTVFHLMIFPGIRQQIKTIAQHGEANMLAANNLLVHYIVPWLVMLYYLFCAPGKNTVSLLAAPLWLLFPLAYAGVIFLHAASGKKIPGTDRLYPYPFLDAVLLGKKRVFMACAGMLVLCALASVALLLILRALYAFAGGGKPLFLIG